MHRMWITLSTTQCFILKNFWTPKEGREGANFLDITGYKKYNTKVCVHICNLDCAKILYSF